MNETLNQLIIEEISNLTEKVNKINFTRGDILNALSISFKKNWLKEPMYGDETSITFSEKNFNKMIGPKYIKFFLKKYEDFYRSYNAGSLILYKESYSKDIILAKNITTLQQLIKNLNIINNKLIEKRKKYQIDILPKRSQNNKIKKIEKLISELPLTSQQDKQKILAILKKKQ